MPEPKEGETEEAYISRCIRMVMREGKTRTQAAGKCYGMWRSAHGDASSLASQLAQQGVAAGRRPEEYEQKELAIGTKTEMEHTSEEGAAQRIAMAHLEEHPHYYSKILIPAERKATKTEDVLRSALADALPNYPKGHQVGMKVPEGGSNCMKCRFFNNEFYCSNGRFQSWNKSVHGGDGSEIPEEPARYCCDFFMVPLAEEERGLLDAMAEVIVRRVNDEQDRGSSGLRKTLLKTISFGGDEVKIYTVNGEHVRRAREDGGCGTMEFTMGMNGYAARDPSYPHATQWCGEDEVCLQEFMSPTDMLGTMVHEVFERWAMKKFGLGYEEAHETVANPAEREARALLATPGWEERLLVSASVDPIAGGCGRGSGSPARITDDDDVVRWITVNGQHVPIKKGQTSGEAIQSHFHKKKTTKNKVTAKNKVIKTDQPFPNTAEEIIKAIPPGHEYDTIGLRVLTQRKLSVGETVPNSRVWVNNVPTRRPLPGASALIIQKDSQRAPDQRTVERSIQLSKRYWGKKVALVTGRMMEYGEDENEVVIGDAKILAIWDRVDPFAAVVAEASVH